MFQETETQRNYLMFWETKNPEKLFIFSQERSFLIFRESKTLKRFSIFQVTELSYISSGYLQSLKIKNFLYFFKLRDFLTISIKFFFSFYNYSFFRLNQFIFFHFWRDFVSFTLLLFFFLFRKSLISFTSFFCNLSLFSCKYLVDKFLDTVIYLKQIITVKQFIIKIYKNLFERFKNVTFKFYLCHNLHNS